MQFFVGGRFNIRIISYLYTRKTESSRCKGSEVSNIY